MDRRANLMTDEPEKIELKLKWKKTWEERENDFVASSPVFEASVGRIQLVEHGPQKNGWSWALTAAGEQIRREGIGALTGFEPSPREAARAVEIAWFAAIKGSSLDVADPQKPSKNSYAAAKGGE
jgi:hypothetical protein